MFMKLSLIAFLSLIASAAQAQTAAEGIASRADRALLGRLIRAQDTRARADSDLALLKSATQSPNAELRLFAVRALGRLERSEVIPDIAPTLDDSSAAVRLAAVQAIGQAAYRTGVVDARKLLVARLESDKSEDMRAKIAETLGRLAHASADDASNTARLLARLSFDPRAAT
jgi:HEAT repeat protein